MECNLGTPFFWEIKSTVYSFVIEHVMDGTCNVQSLFCRAYKKQHIFQVWEGKPQIHAHVPRKDMVSLQVSHRHK